jgi:hypothetical protein
MYSPNASEANGNQTIPDAWTTRQLSYYPQPVEINPTSYSRAPSSYTSWEAPTYSIGSNGEPNPLLSSSIGHNKSGPLPPDFGARNSPQDPLANWYTGMDGPWIPISTIPVTSQDGMDYHWIGKTGEVDRKMRESMDVFKVKDGQTKYQKIKRGLSGFLNATRVSAIADTGSAQNVISAAYASDLKLPIKHTSSSFQLGNSKTVQSIGKLILEFIIEYERLIVSQGL